MVNYGSCMKSKHTACNMEKHFTEELNHSEEDFDVQIFVQLESVPCQKYQTRKPPKKF